MWINNKQQKVVEQQKCMQRFSLAAICGKNKAVLKLHIWMDAKWHIEATGYVLWEMGIFY